MKILFFPTSLENSTRRAKESGHLLDFYRFHEMALIGEVRVADRAEFSPSQHQTNPTEG